MDRNAAAVAVRWPGREEKVGALPGGLAGLSITWALTMTVSLNFWISFVSEAEAKMSSVERVIEYTELPPEPPLVIEDKKPAPSWPSKGHVAFRNVSMRYRPGLKLVLRDVDLDVAPGSRLALVGRTGAGKSSIATCLFRLVPLASGSVTVDGHDLSQLGLEDVRGRGVCIIPQQPVLFAGDLMSNL